MAKSYFDILIVAPLLEEADVIFEFFKPSATERHGDVLVSTVDTGQPDITAAVVQLPQMGNHEAYEATKSALNDLNAGIVVCIGIAGRLSTDLRLGDVCYTGTVFDVHERQKVIDAPNSKGVIPAFNPEPYVTPRELEIDFFIRTHPELKQQLYSHWQDNGAKKLIALQQSLKHMRSNDDRFRERPIAQNGNIVCGAVSASANYNARLKDMQRSVVGIETESGGVFRAARQSNDTPAITVRGISDFADAKKNRLEASLQGAGRQLATHNAVTFFRSQLANPYFVSFLAQRRKQAFTGGVGDLFDEAGLEADLSTTLHEIIEAITGHLRELSPEYKLQPKGYILPAARIAPIQTQTPALQDDTNFFEIAEALRAHRVIMVDVPRSYPDQSLPWVMADNLSTAVLNDRQVVPIVIRGDEIVPPKSGLAKLGGVKELDSLSQGDAAQVVFIIHGFNLESKTRCAFLAAEIERYPTAKFVFLTKAQGSLLLENAFVQQVVAKPYSICDVPFVAIASFIEKNFGLPPTEAEVIAFRLHNTFERFKLLVHPTYFAGIPRETLSALLQANRRSELIQFAVDGFLAFVVAGDPADISLSLTTRKRFLSRLAVELAVNKNSFTESALIEMAAAFAREHDFEIDPLRFVNTFVEKGILRFADDLVEFTLPFIENYLLALALSRDAELAKRHFAFDEDDFDFETFDLYCEMGAAESIVQALEKRLEHDISTLGAGNTSPGVMLSDEIRPALLRKYDRIADLRTGFRQTIKRLQEKSRNGEEKQKLLDVAGKTARAVSKAPAKKAPNKGDLWKPKRDWQIGCVMLGAAAEQLLADTKQRLASNLLLLGSQLVDVQTRSHLKVNFAEIKQNTISSPEAEEFLSLFKDERERSDMRDLLDTMLDLYEFALFGQPFFSTLNYLCEQSRHKVLASSVSKARVSGEQPEMMRAAWLADLDGRRGGAALKKKVVDLPPAPFLRIVLASHFLHRVYWALSETEDRMALLQAAEETLKALNLGVRKGEIMRLIGRDAADDSSKDPDLEYD